MDRLAIRLQLLGQQLKAIGQDLAALLAAEPELARKLAHLTSVPGIGLTTATVVVAETNGFGLMENERQLASYAGLDVVQRQSGLSAGATRISRRGNVRLRTALYLPAVSSLRRRGRPGAGGRASPARPEMVVGKLLVEQAHQFQVIRVFPAGLVVETAAREV